MITNSNIPSKAYTQWIFLQAQSSCCFSGLQTWFRYRLAQIVVIIVTPPQITDPMSAITNIIAGLSECLRSIKRQNNVCMPVIRLNPTIRNLQEVCGLLDVLFPDTDTIHTHAVTKPSLQLFGSSCISINAGMCMINKHRVTTKVETSTATTRMVCGHRGL